MPQKGHKETTDGAQGSSAKLFEHYLYVLACGDGSLYTGYTTNVADRVAAHQAGLGAKYTKSHAPVELLAQARFYSKERAMSAEAYFKKLSRSEKDALLTQASQTPFEEVLRTGLPGFGYDTAGEFVCRSLYKESDSTFKTFQAKLLPNINPASIVGVRTPALRNIAKALFQREDKKLFLRKLPHRLFEENQVHAFTIGLETNYERALKLYEQFLPHIDNWATCDQLPTRILVKNPDRTLEKTRAWLASDSCYVMRFAIGVLMKLYLDEGFDAKYLDWVAQTYKEDDYYLNMMRAWYFAEALAKQEEAALPYLEAKGNKALLDEWTRRKAIQKALESRRIPENMKAHLRSCR